MRIILASQSPRRKELLKKIVEDFEIIPANIDESAFPLEDIAFEKAKVIAKKYKDALIISADTSVVIQGDVLGKPKDAQDAKRMLNLLSDKMHEVITYYSIYSYASKINVRQKVVTEVMFNKLSKELIDSYVASLSPLDKAGAYGIQDREYNLVKFINGDEDNVIGLPVASLKKDLINLGVITK